MHEAYDTLRTCALDPFLADISRCRRGKATLHSLIFEATIPIPSLIIALASQFAQKCTAGITMNTSVALWSFFLMEHDAREQNKKGLLP